jgi:hypothetical protein
MDEEEAGTLDELPSPRRTTPWEIEEIAAAALLLVVAVLAVAGVAAGIVANTESGPFGRVAVSDALLQSTLWAGVLIAFLVVSALALVWWQVDGWTDALEDLGHDRAGAGPAEEADESDESDEAVAHIRRSRALGTWGAVSLLVIAVAAVGGSVGVVLQQTAIPPSLDWQEVISSSGSALATVILAGVGIYGVFRIRVLCEDITGLDRHAADGRRGSPIDQGSTDPDSRHR